MSGNAGYKNKYSKYKIKGDNIEDEFGNQIILNMKGGDVYYFIGRELDGKIKQERGTRFRAYMNEIRKEQKQSNSADSSI